MILLEMTKLIFDFLSQQFVLSLVSIVLGFWLANKFSTSPAVADVLEFEAKQREKARQERREERRAREKEMRESYEKRMKELDEVQKKLLSKMKIVISQEPDFKQDASSSGQNNDE